MVRSEKTRQFIIEKTATIFNKKGYIGTYLSDLTNATGLTKGSIYGNFKDKNEVAVEAFRYNYKQLTKDIALKLEQVDRSDEQLLVFLDFYKREYRKVFENGGCAILNTAVDADDGNELLKEEVVKALQSWRKTIEEIVEEGIKKSELKINNTADFVIKMIAMIEGSIMLAKVLNEPQILVKNMTLLEEEIKE
ncbi:TetR/AcrR family transcriptional regulator, partial [Xanthovirga aplysinae]|uniref:TetR/AcrR family transcriptional regulator n=1 Tax=Xanthovirga aplysinae TaxID=2529853 RepID=UPI0012BCF6E5